ncbi:hypothetical protein [Nocardia brevicatena]|uniref:hypothetical protein n=1 Tax=Nocardia brevicatena TaxID=37327 RepID=UPI000307F794|nr:hypothetical protein [Nocardia brevicatena]
METIAISSRPSAVSDHVWYAAYGSNMNPDRLRCYLLGGAPDGGTNTPAGHGPGPPPGCRDGTTPLRSIPLALPGLLYFATESAVWTGGRAFYDPDVPATTWVRAYLLTLAQFSDIAAQEMYRHPGTDLDPAEAIRTGRSRLGPGRYETLVCPAICDGLPVLTFTAPWRWRDLPGNAPAPAYLRHIATGLLDTHHWSVPETAGHLATRPGADRRWTPNTVTDLLRDH